MENEIKFKVGDLVRVVDSRSTNSYLPYDVVDKGYQVLVGKFGYVLGVTINSEGQPLINLRLVPENPQDAFFYWDWRLELVTEELKPFYELKYKI